MELNALVSTAGVSGVHGDAKPPEYVGDALWPLQTCRASKRWRYRGVFRTQDDERYD
jgi:hypothetical protein